MTNCETVKISSQTLKSYLRNTIYIFLQQNDIPKTCIFSSFSQSRKGDLKSLWRTFKSVISFFGYSFPIDRDNIHLPRGHSQQDSQKVEAFSRNLIKGLHFRVAHSMAGTSVFHSIVIAVILK